MKKMSFVLIFIITLLACLLCNAETNMDRYDITGYDSYRIDPLSMAISVPQDLVVLNEEERKAADMGDNDLFYAHAPNRKFRVSVELMSENVGINNLTAMPENDKKQYLTHMQQTSDDRYGPGAAVCTLEDINGITYLKYTLSVKYNNVMVYQVSYVSIFNNKIFSITFNPETDEAGNYTAQSQEYIQSIMNRVVYDESALQAAGLNIVRKGMKEYAVNSTDIAISLPSEYYAYWRNMPADALSLSMFGIPIEIWDEQCAKDPELILDAFTIEQNKRISLYKEELGNSMDFGAYDDEQMKRFTACIYNPQGMDMGMDNSGYKITRINEKNYIVSKDYVSGSEKPYYLMAYSMMGDYAIRLSYKSTEPITDEDEKIFMEILRSIVINGEKGAQSYESDWFEISDIQPYQVTIGKLAFSMPAKYYYYDKTNQEDLCIKAIWSDISTLDELMRLAANGTGQDIYVSDYTGSMRIMIKKQNNSELSSINAMNQFQIVAEMKGQFASSNLLAPGISVVSISPFTSDGTYDKLYWVVMRVKNDQYGIEQLVYTTVISNKQYSFTFEKEKITEQDEQELESIINSVVRGKSGM